MNTYIYALPDGKQARVTADSEREALMEVVEYLGVRLVSAVRRPRKIEGGNILPLRRSKFEIENRS